MKKIRFTLVGFITGISFWLIDSAEHWVVYGEPVFRFLPHTKQELWSRVLICVVFSCFGFFIDQIYKKIADKEEQKKRIYETTVIGLHHMLFNIINNVISLKQRPDIAKALNDEDIRDLDDDLNTVMSQMNKLVKLTDITEEKIRQIILHDNAD
jgi:hypothetical protein